MAETFDLKGTLRARRAEETLEKIRPLIQRAGITRLVNLTHLDSIGIPVYSCIRPQSKNLSTSQGKGITPALAMCSAYMEAIETFCAETVQTDVQYRFPERATFPHPVLDLSLLQPGHFYVDNPREHIREWSIIPSLLTDTSYCIPTHYLKFDLSTPVLENALFKKSTTGLASGNTRIEAITHSLFEIIERHGKQAFDRLLPAEKKARLIDLDTVDYPEARFLIERLQENRIDILLFDLPNPFGYPTVSCLIGDQHPLRQLGTYAGSGTHASAGIATCRALTEAIQSRLTYIAGSRDDIAPFEYHVQWTPLTFRGSRHFHELPNALCTSLEQQHDALLNVFSERGLDVLCYAHNAPTDPIHVVKCIIPGVPI